MTITTFGRDWEEAAACDLCGSTEWTAVGAICDRRYGRCGRCGVVRLVDRVAESSLGLLYGHYYEPEDPGPGALAEQLKNPTFAHRQQRLEAFRGSRGQHLFEIGCGDGNFLAFMRRAGWQVDGSEFGAETVALVQRRHGIALMQGDVTTRTPPSAPYPVVAAYHVIEHVYRPPEWLGRVHALIEPDGLLYLQTPNWDSLAHALTGFAWSSMTFPQHVYFFNPASLSALLSRSGFEVLSVTTWDPWHGPGTAAGSLGARAKQLATGRLQWSTTLVAESATAPDAGAPGRPDDHVGRSRGLSTRILNAAGRSLSHLESLVGRGGVVDVIAKRRA